MSVMFNVQIPTGKILLLPVTITPDDGGGGGSFDPTSVVLDNSNPSRSFLYTPVGFGVKVIGTTNNGGLTDPASINFTPLAHDYTFTGPSSGDVNVESTDFTVEIPTGSSLAGPVTITPSDGGGGGTFTPSSVILSTASPSATFTYTPDSVGTKTLSVTNTGLLTDPSDLSYAASSPSAHLLVDLISYWKLDEAYADTRNDSHSTNHLLQVVGATDGVAGLINNTAAFGEVSALACANNSSLQVTGDFFFSLWVRIDAQDPNDLYCVFSKSDLASDLDYYLLYYNTASDGFQFGAGSGVINVKIGAPATTGVWTHLVCWYDSSDQKLRMRVNDTTTYVSASAATLVQSTVQLALGAFSGATQYFLYGSIDEMGFWKRVPTALDITALYNGGAGLPYSSFTT